MINNRVVSVSEGIGDLEAAYSSSRHTKVGKFHRNFQIFDKGSELAEPQYLNSSIEKLCCMHFSLGLM